MRDNEAELRDLFAMSALPKLIPRRCADGGLHKVIAESTANDAYRMADAMLKARKPKPGRPA